MEASSYLCLCMRKCKTAHKQVLEISICDLFCLYFFIIMKKKVRSDAVKKNPILLLQNDTNSREMGSAPLSQVVPTIILFLFSLFIYLFLLLIQRTPF